MVIWSDGDKFEWPFEKDEHVFFNVHVGLSNRAADLDNIIKPLLDTYQSMYEDFNDKYVYGISMSKDIVKRGEEYIDVSIIGMKRDDTNNNT